MVASGLSATHTHKVFGFERIPERMKRVEDAIAETQPIRLAYEKVAKIQEKVTLAGFGIVYDDQSSSEDSAEDDMDISQ